MDFVHQWIIQQKLERARKSALTDVFGAEQQYRNLLREAEKMTGKDSPLVGEILIELHDLYEKQGNSDAADSTWEKIRHILQVTLNQIQKGNPR